jgi:hypothetical protein
MFHGPLTEIPPITFGIEGGFFPGQPPDEPWPLILAAGPDEIGCPEVEPRVGLSFEAMALDAGLLDQFLGPNLVAPEQQPG